MQCNIFVPKAVVGPTYTPAVGGDSTVVCKLQFLAKEEILYFFIYFFMYVMKFYNVIFDATIQVC